VGEWGVIGGFMLECLAGDGGGGGDMTLKETRYMVQTGIKRQYALVSLLYEIGLPNLDSAVPKGSDSGVRCPSVIVN
jgi:hypothetical protein